MSCSSRACILSPLSQPSAPTQPHPLGLTLCWPQKPSHLARPASAGCGHRGIWGLVPGRNEPSWLALGLLEGVTDILPVCFSQGFGHEGWTLPTQRTQGQCTVSFWSLDPLPFPRQLAHLPSLSELSVPSGQQQRLRLRACGWWYQQVPLAAALGQQELSLKAQSRRPHGRPGRPGSSVPSPSTVCVLTRNDALAHGPPRRWRSTSDALLQQVSVYVVVIFYLTYSRMFIFQ